jgi:hypothetical protein
MVESLYGLALFAKATMNVSVHSSGEAHVENHSAYD